MSNFDLSGKISLVTGAAGLLGKQHSIALARAGAIVYMTDISEKTLIEVTEKLNSEMNTDLFKPLVMDVTNESSINSALKVILDIHGKFDILVNNAAIDPKVKQGENLLETSRVENFDLDSWDFQLNVGLKGAFLCSKVFGHHMATNDGGVILNISSDLGVIAPDQRIYRKDGLSEEKQPVKPVTYSVIKHGLLGLTKYLSSYWADKNIRVNAISPGGVFNNQPSDFVEKLESLIPMGRMAKLDEYQSTIQYLCSDASSYMTGQNLILDGGRSVI